MSNAEARGREDARFDEAIDRAVREMLDVEPPSGLRGRVLDRLDALSGDSVASAFTTNPVASAFRRNTRNIWWIAGPVAAAAILVLAVLVPWRHAAPPVTTPAAPSMAKAETPHIVTPAVSPKTSEAPRIVSIPRPAPRRIEDRLVVATVAAVNDTTSQIDPLDAIAPITVAGTHPEAIAPKQIAISPLTPITELQIAPLSPPDRRN